MLKRLVVIAWAAACAAVLTFAPFKYEAHDPASELISGTKHMMQGEITRPAWSSLTARSASTAVQEELGDYSIHVDSIQMDSGAVMVRLIGCTIVALAIFFLIPSSKQERARAAE